MNNRLLRYAIAAVLLAIAAPCERATVFADNSGNYVVIAEKETVALQYHSVNSFSDGMAAVCRNGLWGYIDLSENLVVPLHFDAVEDFASGVAIVMKDFKFGMIDTTGRYLLELDYEDISRTPGSDLFKICKGFDYGLFTLERGMILPAEYGLTIRPDGIIIAWKGTEHGLFDSTGKVLLPMAEGMISETSDKYLIIEGTKELSIYDTRDRRLIPTTYRKINKFHYNVAAFQSGNGM